MILKMKHLVRHGLILAVMCLGQLFTASAQDTTHVIHIIQADKLNVVTIDSVQLNRFIGNAIFRQENTLFYCDSAFINRITNVLDAYGHIHINQNDSIHIYGDYLHYEGDTRMATLKDNARLTDNKITLTGPEIQYDLNAKIGTYLDGGKLVNGSSVLTSRQGYYYADTKDVYFSEDVLLVDPEYTLTTDTLLYNTQTKIATIIAPTTINDGKTVMYATSGQYNTESGEGNFDSRPTIEDSATTVTADRIIMDKKTGLADALGNMVYRDTLNKMTILSNYGKVDQLKKTVLATQHPVVIMEGKSDTLFLASDTLFSGVMRKDTVPKPVTTPKVIPTKKKDNAVAVKKGHAPPPKAPVQKTPGFSTAMNKAVPDTSTPIDTAISNVWRNGSLVLPNKDSVGALVVHAADSIAIHFKDSVKMGDEVMRLKDSVSVLTQAAIQTRDSLRAVTAMRNDSLPIDSMKAFAMPTPTPDTAALDTTEYRYMMAWHHVRIYSDSLQGVSDSLYYTSKDSVFRFFGSPVMWANNVQLSGDTIRLFTKNQTADRMLLDQNSLIVKEEDPKLYDQVKGTQTTIYFKGQALDWIHVDGNAESLYYVRDEDSAYSDVNKTLSGFINIYFVEGELDEIVYQKDAEGTMYPFSTRPMEMMELENFHWDIKRKPKSKYELLGSAATPVQPVAPAKKEEESPANKEEPTKQEETPKEEAK
jgi:lipopolysaccharide export system protein LptA